MAVLYTVMNATSYWSFALPSFETGIPRATRSCVTGNVKKRFFGCFSKLVM